MARSRVFPRILRFIPGSVLRAGILRRSATGGGTYLLVGIGVGIASAAWESVVVAIISGAFWPATLGYWAIRSLRHFALGN